jgi:hypothetical protein
VLGIEDVVEVTNSAVGVGFGLFPGRHMRGIGQDAAILIDVNLIEGVVLRALRRRGLRRLARRGHEASRSAAGECGHPDAGMQHGKHRSTGSDYDG